MKWVMAMIATSQGALFRKEDNQSSTRRPIIVHPHSWGISSYFFLPLLSLPASLTKKRRMERTLYALVKDEMAVWLFCYFSSCKLGLVGYSFLLYRLSLELLASYKVCMMKKVSAWRNKDKQNRTVWRKRHKVVFSCFGLSSEKNGRSCVWKQP